MNATAGPTSRTRVLYIAGSGRSGSTVLANILGSVEGVFCGGEIRYLWERGVREDRLCGCGLSFSACPVWGAILAEAAPEGASALADGMIADVRRGTRVRHVPSILLQRHRSGDRSLAHLGSFPDRTDRIYSAIRRVSGASLVVDSSKLPPYASILDGLPSVDLFVLHLVRDPRATAYSWRRKKPLADGAVAPFMDRQSALKSTVLWDVWNMTASAVWRSTPDRYIRLRYEDLMREPRKVVERILRFAGHDADLDEVFRGERTARVGVSHTVAGNPDRLRSGDLTLSLDDEWATRMRRRDRALVTAVAGPLIGRFCGDST